MSAESPSTQETLREVAAGIVSDVHSRVNWDHWGRYRLTYWSQLVDHVKLCARTTNNLHRFCCALASRFGADITGAASIAQALARPAAEQERLLRLFRIEPDTIVLIARLAVERSKGNGSDQ